MAHLGVRHVALCIVLVSSLLALLFYKSTPLQNQRIVNIVHRLLPYKGEQSIRNIHTERKSIQPENPLLKDLRDQGLVDLPSKEVLKTMSNDSLYLTYHSYLDNVDILCHRKLRMGNLGDGGWEICDDEPYRPITPCLVYSFGINNDFSFDDDTARVYQCKVYSFDPSMAQHSYQRSPLVYFSQLGISGEDTTKGKWKLLTFGHTMDLLNHTGRIVDVLKMDVERSEWNSLPQMIESGEILRVRQFLVEYHTKEPTYEQLAVLKDLYDLGFRKFYVHKNPACSFPGSKFPVKRTFCYEVHYVNVNIR